MQDRVGSNLPEKQVFDDIQTRLTGLVNDSKPFTVSLSADERVRVTKFRQGGDRIVEIVAALAQKYMSDIPGLSIAGMKNDLVLAQQLRPIASQAQALADTYNDTVREAESECWWVTTAYYTALCRIADSNPKLADELRPVIDFFSTGRRRKAAAETPTP